jgi:hypothetical protein
LQIVHKPGLKTNASRSAWPIGIKLSTLSIAASLQQKTTLRGFFDFGTQRTIFGTHSKVGYKRIFELAFGFLLVQLCITFWSVNL